MEDTPDVTKNDKKQWFHPLSALVMIVCDFGGIAGDFFGSFLWVMMSIIMVGIFAITFTLVYFTQKIMAGDSTKEAILKAALAGVLCALPMPIFGTLAGSIILIRSGLREGRSSLWKRKGSG